MSAVSGRPVLSKTRIAHNAACRALHSSSRASASILFALSSLSNSRETQHFNKLSRLDRVEHSPPLKLIKSSEIDPFAPLALSRRAPEPAVKHAGAARRATQAWDERALKAGRVVLADGARREHLLQKALRRARSRERRHAAAALRDRSAWAVEASKLRGEVRSAAVLILLSIAAATALATARFWPSSGAERGTSALDAKLAARIKSATSLPDSTLLSTGSVQSTSSTAPSEAASLSLPSPAPLGMIDHTTRKSWWRGFLWKQ